jgi:hypothetical protein
VAGSATWTAEIAPLAEAEVERLPATEKILRTIESFSGVSVHTQMIQASDEGFTNTTQDLFRFSSGALS